MFVFVAMGLICVNSLTCVILSYICIKELGFFPYHFALTLPDPNICLTHITPSILISANALGYILSIKVEFVMRNIMPICLFCSIHKGGLKSTISRKLKKTNKTVIFNVISFESASI